MATNIGLMDYDTLRQRKYRGPNYDLGITYGYLKKNVNFSVRLISAPTISNLKQYDKIYVFKQDIKLAHPSSYIPEYYSLPIEEFGPGFINRPLRPFLLETKTSLPDFSCYNSMILFSLNKPQHRIAWKIGKGVKGGKYQHVRLYELFENEWLKKDYPQPGRIVAYDNPNDILNDPQKFAYYEELLDNKRSILFALPLDVASVLDTTILERVFNERKFSGIRKKLIATSLNDKVQWLVSNRLDGTSKKNLQILCLLDVQDLEQCFEQLLIMIYYLHKSKNTVWLRAGWSKAYLRRYELAHLAYKFLNTKAYSMSFYEYLFNIAYKGIGVPQSLIHTGEDRYEYIMNKYGTAPLLIRLETWLQAHPHFEEHIFIGGDSNYGKSRKRYYDISRSTRAFTTSANDISEELSSQ